MQGPERWEHIAALNFQVWNHASVQLAKIFEHEVLTRFAGERIIHANFL